MPPRKHRVNMHPHHRARYKVQNPPMRAPLQHRPPRRHNHNRHQLKHPPLARKRPYHHAQPYQRQYPHRRRPPQKHPYRSRQRIRRGARPPRLRLNHRIVGLARVTCTRNNRSANICSANICVTRNRFVQLAHTANIADHPIGAKPFSALAKPAPNRYSPL